MNPPCGDFDGALFTACGQPLQVHVVTAAVQPAGDPERSMVQARQYFGALGADAIEVSLRRRSDASRPEVVEMLRASRLTYLLGGNPGYLLDTLRDTPAWQGIQAGLRQGGGLAGSSAGAMVVCDALLLRSSNPNPRMRHWRGALRLLGELVVIPHFTQFGGGWLVSARRELPGADILGLDESTGIMYAGGWRALGPGEVRLFRHGGDKPVIYGGGRTLRLRAPALV